MTSSHLRRAAVRAFTLMEILVVVTIILVLAAIVIPAYHNVQARAGQVQATST